MTRFDCPSVRPVERLRTCTLPAVVACEAADAAACAAALDGVA